MLKLKEIEKLIESLENLKLELKEKFQKELKENNDFLCCIHIRENLFVASVWKKGKSEEKDYNTWVTPYDIINGKKVSIEQDRYAQHVQLYLYKINEL